MERYRITQWYNKPGTIIALLIFFFPVGLFGLWRSDVISRQTKIIGTFLTSIMVLIALLYSNATMPTSEELAHQQASADSLKIQEYKIDSINQIELQRKAQLTEAYYSAKNILKEYLNDSDSYQEVSHEEYYISKKKKSDPYAQVILKYRAKNAFGAMILDSKIFDFDKNMNIIKVQ